MGNLVGLDLNIDQNFLTDAVRQTVIMGISESLNGKNEIVSQLVNMVLNTKVREQDGKLPQYACDKTCTLLEYHVRQAIKQITAEELQAIVEEKKPEIKKAIRKELNKEKTMTNFVDAFVSEVISATTNTWCPKIQVEFERRKEY